MADESRRWNLCFFALLLVLVSVGCDDAPNDVALARDVGLNPVADATASDSGMSSDPLGSVTFVMKAPEGWPDPVFVEEIVSPKTPLWLRLAPVDQETLDFTEPCDIQCPSLCGAPAIDVFDLTQRAEGTLYTWDGRYWTPLDFEPTGEPAICYAEHNAAAGRWRAEFCFQPGTMGAATPDRLDNDRPCQTVDFDFPADDRVELVLDVAGL